MIEEEKKEDSWRSCCLTIDKGAVKYFIQSSVLVGIIVLSASMLVVSPDCNSQRNWSALLTLCLGVFLPAPKLTSD